MARAKKAYRLDHCRCLSRTTGQRAVMAGWPGRGNDAPRPGLPTLLERVADEAHHRLGLLAGRKGQADGLALAGVLVVNGVGWHRDGGST